MILDLKTFVIVCPLVFLAGFVDAIGGGGGLISLPAYMIAGVPTHMAIATNKLSSMCGTSLATARFIKNKLVNLKLSIPSVIFAITGAFLGAKLSLLLDERILKIILMALLPVIAIVVLNRKLFSDKEDEEIVLDKKTYLTAALSALVVGMYDGFYGPGTGTFLIIAFTVFTRMSVRKANAQAKVINLTTNVTSLLVFIYHGQVVFLLGIAAAICNMIGGYIGAGLVMKNAGKIVRPVIIGVLILLFVTVVTNGV